MIASLTQTSRTIFPCQKANDHIFIPAGRAHTLFVYLHFLNLTTRKGFAQRIFNRNYYPDIYHRTACGMIRDGQRRRKVSSLQVNSE